MKPSLGAVLALSLAPAAADAQRRPAPTPARDVAIVSAGSEQAVRLGDVTLSRPFGAQLVDRLAVAGSYAVNGRRLHLIRGEAAGDCPARFVVVEAARGADPVVSDPFGTCSPAASARVSRGALVVSMPATAAGGPPVRFAYQGGAVRLLDARPAAAPAADAGGAPGYAAPAPSSCRSAAGVDAATQAEILADFERSYPAEYRRAKTLENAAVAPDELRGLLTGMACLATWPGSERVVEVARPLFESRHGPQAFATLDAIARDPLTEANLQAAVRRFSAEMTYQVGDDALD
ncbi:hypothetical protein [Sphingomonas lenta]|uniref:DUF4476 domain-containing protein n=1 Tax=Sphingomonas lenta TaxID=1141887 RepID=A0A2A2SCJ0_9SPHN|nr:hypothetical protein [Sphingomonas lenta]PAX06969.1 hypothetical protein CKY28_12945 [Sphingomonas lenta]